MFGTYYFGQSYFGQIEIPVAGGNPTDNCGGAFGSATFGSLAFAELIECGDIPPTPPPTPITPVRRQVAGSSQVDYGYLRERLIDDLIQEEIDEEDIAQIVSLWLNIK